MKHRLKVLIILLLAFLACTSCTDRAQNSQTPEVSSSAKPQASQQIQTPTPSPNISKEPQPTIYNNNAITKSEVLSFLNDDNKLATNMLHYPAKDMNDLRDVIAMMLYPLGASRRNPISFDVFNKYTEKYLNRSYTDSEFAKYATDEDAVGNNVIMSKRILYYYGMGGEDFLLKNVEITGNDSALITCYQGSLADMDPLHEVGYKVQFGRANSQLYFKSISKLYAQKVQGPISVMPS